MPLLWGVVCMSLTPLSPAPDTVFPWGTPTRGPQDVLSAGTQFFHEQHLEKRSLLQCSPY